MPSFKMDLIFKQFYSDYEALILSKSYLASLSGFNSVVSSVKPYYESGRMRFVLDVSSSSVGVNDSIFYERIK